MSAPEPSQHAPATVDTVEAVVRAQIARALGGKRGILEAAVPTVVFTLFWITTKELQLALISVIAQDAVDDAAIANSPRLPDRDEIETILRAVAG